MLYYAVLSLAFFFFFHRIGFSGNSRHAEIKICPSGNILINGAYCFDGTYNFLSLSTYKNVLCSLQDQADTKEIQCHLFRWLVPRLYSRKQVESPSCRGLAVLITERQGHVCSRIILPHLPNPSNTFRSVASTCVDALAQNLSNCTEFE